MNRPLRNCVICGKTAPRGAHGYMRWTCSDKCLREAHRLSVRDAIIDRGYEPWTKELVIAAIQRWHRRYGRPPSAQEWHEGQGSPPGGFRTAERPSTHGVRIVFGTWSAAIEAAGFTNPGRGRWRKNPAKCRAGKHDWVPENMLVNGRARPTCKPCRNEKARARKAA